MKEKVYVFAAHCIYLDGAHFRVTFVPDGDILGVDLYRDALSACIGGIDGLLGEDMQIEMSQEQIRDIGMRVTEAEREAA